MPAKYLVLDEGKLVIEKIWGKVSYNELMENEQKQQNDANIADGAVILSDLRELTLLKYNPAIVKELIGLYKESGMGKGIVKCALLVDVNNWSHAKEMEKDLNQQGFNLMVFNLFDVACLWLGIDEVRAATILSSLSA